MIDDISVSINFSGDKFSPTKGENITGLIFSDKIEFGDIGVRGKYKGKPVPYGSGTLKVSKDINMHNRILWLTEALSGKLMFSANLDRMNHIFTLVISIKTSAT